MMIIDESVLYPTILAKYHATLSGMSRSSSVRRIADVLAGSISPQDHYGTPVRLMFFEGAACLVGAGVTIPGHSKTTRKESSSRPIRAFWPGPPPDGAAISIVRRKRRQRINVKHEGRH